MVVEYGWPATPSGKALVVMLSGVDALATSMLSGCWLEAPTLSCTRTVKLLVPLAVGVPEIRPVDAVTANPAGRLPETTLQV
jgi:hypothetical protein